MDINCRKVEKKDRRAIRNICYLTGYMGESLEGREIFNDRKLFGLIFCMYYPVFEPENSFVAVDESDQPVGYIMGTLDTIKQKKRFSRYMHWKILARMAAVTWWRYPGSLLELCRWLRTGELPEPDGLYDEYPAHLHMNLLPEFQGIGLGQKLINLFISHAAGSATAGLHLATSSRNVKALPFYEKTGFIRISNRPSHFWSDVENYREIIYAMKLNGLRPVPERKYDE